MAVRITVGTVLLVIVWAAVNWMVQVVRKPSEVFVAVSGSLAKAPAETWRQYGPLFNEHATAVITPELLAALDRAASPRPDSPKRERRCGRRQRDIASFLLLEALRR